MSQWIRIDADIERNRKILDLRTRLAWSANDCLARLVRLFSAVREQAPSGDLRDWTIAQIACAMEPGGGLGDEDALLDALLVTRLLLKVDGRLLIKGWPERNGAFLNENRRSHQRIEAGKRRSAGALRDASGRYLSSDQPATGQRRPSEQLSQRGSSSRPAQPPTAHRRSPAVVQRSALAGVPGPAQVVAGASTGQRLSSEGPAQPAEQYKTRQDKEESGDCTSSSPSLRSGEVSARTAHSLIALTNESKATARPKPAAKRWPTITDDESRVPTAEESARVRASWMAALSERKGTELDGHDPTGDSRV